mgnify:CR=1 FL=1
MKLNEKQRQAVDFIESPKFRNFFGILGRVAQVKQQRYNLLISVCE